MKEKPLTESQEKKIRAAAEKIFSPTSMVQIKSLGILLDYAEGGRDISAAIPQLAKTMEENFGRQAARILLLTLLNEKTKEKTLESIIQTLESRNPRARENAVWILKKFAGKKAVIFLSAIPALAKALEDENIEVRKEAFQTLANFVENWNFSSANLHHFLKAIIKGSKDENAEVRWNANAILEYVKRESMNKSKEELLRFLRKTKSSPEFKEFARKIFNEWLQKQNKETELQIPRNMRKPLEKPLGRSMKKLKN
ncbi:HEAT repeat domain-containing protein [Candidatus Micrarchaeota archaeon]|nr:HEAT repeat domain-containing protein [Candidatus Micrarchaeota archaeon]